MKIKIFDNLDKFLSKSLEIEKIIRWEKYFKTGKSKKENSLQHSYVASLLALIVLDNEMNNSEIPPNSYLVLKSIILHDLGEIEEGDTVYIDKNEEGDKREYEFFKNLVDNLPENNKESFILAYNLQNTNKNFLKFDKNKYNKEIKLFEAIERLGYLLFGYNEYTKYNREEIFVQILRHQHKHLVRLSKELPRFGKTFYNGDIRESIEKFLEKYEGKYIEKGRE